MSATTRVLVVDDDDFLLEDLIGLFEVEGYVVAGATTREEALQRLADEDWHLVVLDQKLKGPEHPDTGLQLIDQARIHVPGAKIIIISGYATPQSIQRAFAAGADDFIEKKGAFGEILRHKARQAIEAVRQRRLLTLQTDERERQLTARWHAALTEADRNRKGPLLEETMLLLFQTLPGFIHIRPSAQNALEEIDLLIRNESSHPFWQRQSPYLLVECKNWSSRIGAPEFTRFVTKMKHRYGLCRLGFLVSVGGFADTVKLAALAGREGEHLVILLNRDDLTRLIEAPPAERLDRLTALHDRAIVAVNGTH